jgi:hypothetical protein
MTEDELRTLGYPKTPDFKLNIPIIVGDRVVNWVESKGSFGDDKNHEFNREQFQAYKNRYGPGLVIYWFGFVEELQEDDKDILLADHFPDEIIELEAPKLTFGETTTKTVNSKQEIL